MMAWVPLANNRLAACLCWRLRRRHRLHSSQEGVPHSWCMCYRSLSSIPPGVLRYLSTHDTTQLEQTIGIIGPSVCKHPQPSDRTATRASQTRQSQSSPHALQAFQKVRSSCSNDANRCWPSTHHTSYLRCLLWHATWQTRRGRRSALQGREQTSLHPLKTLTSQGSHYISKPSLRC